MQDAPSAYTTACTSSKPDIQPLTNQLHLVRYLSPLPSLKQNITAELCDATATGAAERSYKAGAVTALEQSWGDTTAMAEPVQWNRAVIGAVQSQSAPRHAR
jgi:hypothetical protein